MLFRSDRYERLTAGYLPSAEVAFLDEVFKANSAILNTLLGLLHERSFDNGQHRVDVPLVCLVGASNEVPQDESLHAFYDRVLLRVPVTPVDDARDFDSSKAPAKQRGEFMGIGVFCMLIRVEQRLCFAHGVSCRGRQRWRQCRRRRQ